MNFIHIETQEYPIDEYTVRERCTPTALPADILWADLPGLGYAQVVETEPPFYNPQDTLEEGTPVEIEGVWTQTWVVIAGEFPSLNSLKSKATLENNAAFEAAMKNLTSAYPPSEIQSWEVQRQEALAWQADNETPTPWITTAAMVRGVERLEYLARTLSKIEAFSSASAFLIGRRQNIDDAIRAAEDAAALSAVVISYSFPGFFA